MKRTVLICDDVPFVRKTLRDILVAAHFTVVGEAETGTQAFEMYCKLKPDVVTMDIVMPEMSGIEATKKIVKRDKDAKVVVISAMGQEQLIMEAIGVGAKDYVQKPFNAQDILKAIDNALNGADKLTSRSASA